MRSKSSAARGDQRTSIIPQEPLKAPADFLVGEIFAPLKSFLAPIYRFNETALLIEITRNDFLYQLVRITALLSSRLHELRFDLGREVYLHVFRL